MRKIVIDFWAMEPENQIKFVFYNCEISMWPLFPFMPLVNGDPHDATNPNNKDGFMYAGDVFNGNLVVYEGNVWMVMAGVPTATKTIDFKSEAEMAAAGWRIDE